MSLHESDSASVSQTHTLWLFSSQPNLGKRSVSKIPWYNCLWSNGLGSTHLKNCFQSNLDTWFLSQELGFAPKSTKEVAYKTLVWPKLEYAAPIWSPYSKLQINQVERAQRTVARWTCRRWRNTSSVGEMLDELEWPSFEAVGIGPPCFSFIKYILVLCL